ncbi:hypothetical protein H8B02_06460 [Bradyrhizobium sp. Pear77]|uniref:hypothetical protein n=1 Tax=Bradyrhizobium altum TaxID=1571202 RepID=UPI001E3918F8|nr:hypothetical protein [Bradyrhizobium altum]MCC8953121.1 hypothetical protein [Bradyrhizobium altum]
MKYVLASMALLIIGGAGADASPAERYDLLFTEANYTSADQHQLKYASFVGDRKTGGIYSCSGTVLLDGKTGNLQNHSESCAVATQPGSEKGDYTFGRVSALDASGKPDSPRMNPSWGFWRIDQAKPSHSFCMRFGASKVVWSCFETPLPN